MTVELKPRWKGYCVPDPMQGFAWEQKSYGPPWSMIYVPVKFQFNVLVSFRNGFLISKASKTLARMERGILIPIHASMQIFFEVFGSRDVWL